MKEKKYNFFDKQLHKIILKSKLVKSTLFELEKIFFLKNEVNVKCLFITGLPRSGSTSLLYSLDNSNLFGSLKYSDMPFILSPNIWKNLTYFLKKKNEDFERHHQDGIIFNQDSPEAFEEVFWMNLLNEKYIGKNLIHYHNINNDNICEFKNFIKLIITLRKSKYYLSKNNNNILRLKDLSKNIENSIFFVIFRNPYHQAISLQKQYFKFIELQNQDAFIEEYMNMIGHFEFGKNYKEFFFGKQKIYTDKNKIEYWIELWIEAYAYLYKSSEKKKNIIFLSYEEICKNKIDYLKSKIKDEEIIQNINLNNFTNKNKGLIIKECKILDEALKFYNLMMNRL